MYNIDEKLNEIVFKYNLDRFYPQYRKMLNAKVILQRMVEDLMTLQVKTLFIADDETVIRMVSCIAKEDKCAQFFYCKNFDLDRLEQLSWKDYDKVVMLSFFEVEYIFRWLRSRGIKYEWIYDVFEFEGLIFERDFYKFCKEEYENWFDNFFPGKSAYYKDAIQMELYFQQQKMEYATNKKIRQIALEKCFFLTIYFRNFIKAEKYAKLLVSETSDNIWLNIWDEIKEMLNDIKTKLEGRRVDDIVLYWLDALEYGAEVDMVYLQDVISRSISFENAFTSTPFTNATVKAMFLGKKTVDDQMFNVKKIKDEDSELLTFLSDRGYEVKFISGYLNEFESDKYIDTFVDILAPVSMKLWWMIQEMLEEKKKTIYVLHAISETHHPYLSTSMTDELMTDRDSGIWKAKRFKQGRKELDDQLKFYDVMINRDISRIYMSDHGQAEFRTRYHIHFNVLHKNVKPRIVSDMFSILDFDKVLKQLIDDGQIDEKEFSREYVEIQDVDWYSKQRIEKLIKNRENIPVHMFGYKGVIDKENMYIHFNVGKEWLQNRKGVKFEPISGYSGGDVYNENLLEAYRNLAGEYPMEVKENEKFRYSKYIHMLYHTYVERCNDKINVFSKMLEKYPKKSVAIRTGGIHAERFYTVLPKECKEKIWGFIDDCPDCKCKCLELPIITKEDIPKYNLQAIILCSYNEREVLIKESREYEQCEIIDMYGCLENEGIVCKNWFYLDSNMSDADYDVGFKI